MINTSFYGNSAVFSWTKDYLLTVLMTGKTPILTDPLLINAFKTVDRVNFVPELFQKQAYGDYELDIGYGEKLNKPTTVAQMISYLKPQFGGKYLDVGTGTGYVAAILGFCAGDNGRVYSMERVQWLWEMARENMKKVPAIKNVELLYRDGMEGLIQKAPFDGIHISFFMQEIPEQLKRQLRIGGGILVCPTPDHNLKIIERKGESDFVEEIVQGFVFDSAKVGTA